MNASEYVDVAPLFLGSHAAVDFLNTWLAPHGDATETIGDGKAFSDWLVAAGLLEREEATRLARRFGVKALDASAAEARRMREWARDWLVRWRETPRADYSEEIGQLNRLLARSPHVRVVSKAQSGLALLDTPAFDTASALIALPAVEIARLVADEDPWLLRACAGDACTLWFLDRTKSHRRLFCSATACGNRAKVAAFRERQKQ
jgi:predicted RNA-binding Zn ribbon-like protein